MEQIKATETLVDSSLRETKMHGTVGFPVGVYLDDFSDFKNGYICWHWHEEIQISWIIEGEFLCQMEGRTVRLHPGELIFVNRGVLHQIYPVQKGYGRLYAFLWDPEFISGGADSAVYQEAFDPMLKSGPRCLTLAETLHAPGRRPFGDALRKIVTLYTLHPAYYHLQVKILLSQIWLLLCRQEGEAPEPMTPERERDEERLKSAMNYMHAHYSEHFSLEELAQQALTSRSELCRCFRRMLGIPPKEFLMRYRIQQAEILLKNSAYSIAEVAEFTGFSSPSHFGSCFLRYVGCTPREYRKGDFAAFPGLAYLAAGPFIVGCLHSSFSFVTRGLPLKGSHWGVGDAAPYTRLHGGCRGEHCSPAGTCAATKLHGRTLFTPTLPYLSVL